MDTIQGCAGSLARGNRHLTCRRREGSEAQSFLLKDAEYRRQERSQAGYWRPALAYSSTSESKAQQSWHLSQNTHPRVPREPPSPGHPTPAPLTHPVYSFAFPADTFRSTQRGTGCVWSGWSGENNSDNKKKERRQEEE